MTAPIALQLYSLRREAEDDFAAVLERVAATGYLGVESAGLHGMPAEDLRRRLDALGLQVTSAFVWPLPLSAAALDEQQILGNDVLVTGLGPEDFASLDALDRAAEQFNEAAETVQERGMTLGYHNHWWEFTASPVGPSPMGQLLERLSPGVFLELDIYWLQTAGLDPADTLSQLGDRVRRLHVKDGPCTQTDPMTAVGAGRMDIPTVLAAVPDAEWHIVELDECAGDMFEAVEASYQYLTDHGLSRGRR